MGAQLLTVLALTVLAVNLGVKPGRKYMLAWLVLFAVTLLVITWYLGSIP
jgi:lipopolysaccharide export LptBFGC system permease protein LptF